MSVNFQQKSCQEWPTGCLCYNRNLCPSVRTEPAKNKQRWKTHQVVTNTFWHQITYLSWGVSRPVEVFEGWAFLFFSLFFSLLLCSFYASLICLLIMKKRAMSWHRFSFHMTWKDSGSCSKACLWAFLWRTCSFCCFRLAACLHQRKWMSFQVTGHDRLSLGSLCFWGVALMHASSHHV